MRHLSVLIKPASSLCNLRCRYCFYADVSDSRDICSYGIMNHKTAELIIDQIFMDLTDGDMLTVAFQGGEPTVAGLPCIEHFVNYAKSKNPGVQISFTLQTNGILLDDDWCIFLKKHNFLVGLSLDGPAAIHNQNRVDPHGHGTHSAVLDAKRRLDRYRVEYNILCVLTNETARHPQQIWKFIEDQTIDFIQFIPCLDKLDSNGQAWALSPQRFYSFYSSLFNSWHKAAQNGKYVSIKLFDDIVNLFLYHHVTSCGLTGRCSMQYVVEADGSVYPCDFYVLDEYRLGNLCEMTPSQLFEQYQSSGFQCSRDTLPPACTGCPYQKACFGGCKRMKKHMYINGNYCGYRNLLDTILTTLCQDAKKLLNHRQY